MLGNPTPFSAEAAPLFDEHGAEVVVLMAKATFVRRGGKLVIAEEQAPIRLVDVPTDPEAEQAGGMSSVRLPSDLSGQKPGADIVVVGCAISPRPVQSVDVAVRAPGRSVVLRVHGERLFHKGALGIRIGPAAPFERAPVTYERAYGGSARGGQSVDWRNPVGRGVCASPADLDGTLAPSIEDPAHPIDGARPSVPVGLGAVPMSWLPRSKLIGTMDAAWQKTRMPLFPADFDPKFYQVAPSPLQMERPLEPGDVIAAQGLSPHGVFDVTVPPEQFTIHLRRASGPKTTLALALDTALLFPEDERIELTYRKVVPLGRGQTLLREARLDVSS